MTQKRRYKPFEPGIYSAALNQREKAVKKQHFHGSTATAAASEGLH